MRLLLTCSPLPGHVACLIPIAQALEVAGHEVRFASSKSFRPHMERWGFQYADAGLDWLGTQPRTWPVKDLISVQSRYWTTEEFAQWRIAMYVDTCVPPMVDDLMRLVDSWSPDLILTEEWEFGGNLVAERLGIPHVAAAHNGYGGVDSPELGAYPGNRLVLAEALDRRRNALGLPPDPQAMQPFRGPRLRFFPPSWDRPGLPPVPNIVRCRYEPPRGPEAEPPRWVDELPDRPTIVVSRGSLHQRTRGVLEAIIRALASRDVNVVMALGGLDPKVIPRMPNLHLARWLPQAGMMAGAQLLIGHGGANSAVEAMAAGVPMVVIPVLGDHLYVGERTVALGVARAIEPEDCTPAALREAVLDVLGDPQYRANAQRLQAEIAAQPGPEEWIPLLERLANRNRARGNTV